MCHRLCYRCTVFVERQSFTQNENSTSSSRGCRKLKRVISEARGGRFWERETAIVKMSSQSETVVKK